MTPVHKVIEGTDGRTRICIINHLLYMVVPATWKDPTLPVFG